MKVETRKFKKKPVVISAMQFDGLNGSSIANWMRSDFDGTVEDTIKIKTLEGVMSATMGDWIIKGIKGEFYPCKPDIFEATYEAVTEEVQTSEVTDPLFLLRHCISIDIETTGLDPLRNGIISIGAQALTSQDCFEMECFLDAHVEYDPRALAINGEREEDLRRRNADPEKYFSAAYALQKLIEFAQSINATVIIGKNPGFDYKFLLSVWLATGGLERDFPFTYRLIDYTQWVIPLMLKAGIQIPEKGVSSSDIQNFLGLAEEPKPHTALNGARWNVFGVKKVLEKYGIQ